MPNHTKESKQKRKLRRKGEGEAGTGLMITVNDGKAPILY